MPINGTPVERPIPDESSLSVNVVTLRSAVGRLLGYGPGPSWNGGQLIDIMQVIHRGVRQFYHPPILRGETTAHAWTFLRPVATITTVADQGEYDLDAGFGGLVGTMTFTESSFRDAVQSTSENMIRTLRQKSDKRARPKYVGVRPKLQSPPNGQRFELAFWPIPDGVYSLTFQYSVNPEELSTDNPYPLGGMVHGETVLASCLAIAEQQLDNQQSRHYAAWMARLAASVAYDRNIQTPDYFGYNGNSDDRSVMTPRRYRRGEQEGW